MSNVTNSITQKLSTFFWILYPSEMHLWKKVTKKDIQILGKNHLRDVVSLHKNQTFCGKKDSTRSNSI